ncbi:MAG TPA: SBBP repeat-containing protein [Acidimicrobiales bacterium]|nr:SBBP repeat-containing protein [Acidimicrobiales bacterium]
MSAVPVAAGASPGASDPGSSLAAPPKAAPPAEAAAAKEAVNGLPVRFEANGGRLDPAVRFVSRGGGHALFLTETGAVLSFSRPSAGPGSDGTPAVADVVRMSLGGANPHPEIVPTATLAGVSNYLIGSDRSTWRTGVPGYAGVRYRNVYPGIDLVWHGAGPAGAGGLEYDFEVAPGADPGAIAISFEGAGTPTVDGNGDLVLHTAAAELRQPRPRLYQGGTARAEVDGGFRVAGDMVSFGAGAYDHSRPLTIDPLITYSTFLAGSIGGDSRAQGVAVDASGNAYVTGLTFATDYPVTTGVVQTAKAGISDQFVTKINTAATGAASLVWSTYLGGTGYDSQPAGSGSADSGVAVDGSGNVYVTGSTASSDFPILNGFDTTCGSGAACNSTDNVYPDGVSVSGSTSYNSATANFVTADVGLAVSGSNIPAGTTIASWVDVDTVILSQAATVSSTASFTIAKRDYLFDGFLAKLNPTGTGLLYSSYVGGGNRDFARGIALGASGTAYVSGITYSRDLPTAGAVAAFQPGCGTDSLCNATNFVSADGVSNGTTTYTSASARFDNSFVGRAITATNIPGGTTIASVTNEHTLVLSQAGIGSSTATFTVAAVSPQPDAFLVKVNTSLSGSGSLSYATYLGGSAYDSGNSVAVDGSGVAYLAGAASSTDFPHPNGFQVAVGGGEDVFVAKVDPSVGGAGGLTYGTYLGGSANDWAAGLAIDGSGNAYLTGLADSTNFPTAPSGSVIQSVKGGFGADAFVAKVKTVAPSSLTYSTYLGGNGTDQGYGIALDGASPPGAVVTGSTSGGVPQVNAMQNCGGGASDAFVTSVNDTGTSLNYSSCLGSSLADQGNAIAVDSSATHYVYVAGETTSAGFPTQGAYQPAFQGTGTDGFLTKIHPTQSGPQVTGLSPRGGPITGATPLTITGSSFTGATAVKFAGPGGTTTLNSGFTVVGDTQITVAGTPACLGSCTSIANDTYNVTVTTASGTSVTNANSRFVYGEGLFGAASCPASPCAPGFGRLAKLTNGKVLGVTQNGSGAALFDPLSGTWTAIAGPSTTGALVGSTLTALQNGKALLAGGQSVIGASTAAAYLFDPAGNGGSGSWSQAGTGGVMTSVRAYHSATLLNSGKVLIAGGCTTGIDCEELDIPSSHGLASAELYNPVTNTFTATGTMAAPHFGHGAALLNTGLVLVAGGGGGQSTASLTSAAKYDPVAGTWANAGTMATGRYLPGLALLTGSACGTNCGKVLIAGGSTLGPGSFTATAELFDPTKSAAQAFSSTTSMSTARGGAFVTTMPSGQVLVTGGASTNNDIAERFDPVPATPTWASAGGMSAPGTGNAGSHSVGTGAVLAGGPSLACGTNCGRVLVAEQGAGTTVVDLYAPLPKVTSVLPATDCPSGGSGVSVSGFGLTGATSAKFGATAASSVTADATRPDTRLTVASSPAGPTARDITVTTPGGVSLTSTADLLSYTATAVPCQPQNVVAQAKDGQAVVTWSAPTVTGGSAVIDYTVTAIPPSADANADTPFTDGVSNGTTTYTSASAKFSSADAGKKIWGTNIPAGATISSVTNATTIVLSSAATGSGSGLAFTIAGRGYLAPASVVVAAPNTTGTISGLTNALTNASIASYSFSVSARNTQGSGPAAVASTGVFPQVTDGQFTPVTPTRILDTRAAFNTGSCPTPGTCTTLTPSAETLTLQVSGQGGIPSGATAVTMNVTVTGATACSVLYVYPADAAQPAASNLNYCAGDTVPNLVTVKLSAAAGQLKITNAFGSVEVIADVAGYYSPATSVAASRYNPVAPARILDTRPPPLNAGSCPTPSTCTTLNPSNETITLQVTGQGGVPAGASAVVMNVTVTNPNATEGGSVLTVWPADVGQPAASNLNYANGQTVPNLVAVKVSADGKVKINNAFGSVDVIADVAGWYAPVGSVTGTRFNAVTPGRILDTRSGVNYGSCPGTCVSLSASAETEPVKVAGQVAQGGATPVPAAGASAVVMNVTITNANASEGASVLTVFPSDVAQPGVSNLNYLNGQTVPNLVYVKLGSDGFVKVNNLFGDVDVIADVAGWFTNGSD